MSPVYIKTRTAKSGKRYVVYWRRGGRGYPEEYGGSFKTKRDATIRRDFIAGELAAGRDPTDALAALKRPRAQKHGLGRRWDEFIASRIDVGTKARAQYRNARDRWLPLLEADRDPHTINADDVIAGIAGLGDLAPSSVGQYVSTLAMVLDFAGVEPNPVRSPRVKLPRSERQEKELPSNEAWQAIRDAIRRRSRLAVRLEEACALRVSEACKLEWGDLDLIEGMARIRREGTKTEAGRRWVPVPGPLLDEVAQLLPLEDRRARRLALGLKTSEVAYDLDRACVAAGVVEYGTHALRHRRISLWLRHGIDPVQVAAWAGHAKPSESLNTYGHVVLDPRGDEWRSFWLGVYGRETATRKETRA